jgi:hypothetical protein
MGQIIDIDQWRRRAGPPIAAAPAGKGLASWQAFPPTLVDPFVLASMVLWRSSATAYADWWLASLAALIKPMETSQSARTRERLSSQG